MPFPTSDNEEPCKGIGTEKVVPMTIPSLRQFQKYKNIIQVRLKKKQIKDFEVNQDRQR